jgi:hypothetical protein
MTVYQISPFSEALAESRQNRRRKEREECGVDSLYVISLILIIIAVGLLLFVLWINRD